MNIETIFQFCFVVTFTAVAITTDLRSRRIPNWLTVAGAIAGLFFHFFTQGTAGVWFSLSGFGVGFGLLFVLWCIGGGGGGDVKLMGAVGTWMGPVHTLVVFFLSVLFSMLCLSVVVLRSLCGRPVSPLPTSHPSTTSAWKRTIPYALPCGLAVWSVLAVQLFAKQ